MPRIDHARAHAVSVPIALYERIAYLVRGPHTKGNGRQEEHCVTQYIIEILELWLLEHRTGKAPVLPPEHYTASRSEEDGP